MALAGLSSFAVPKIDLSTRMLIQNMSEIESGNHSGIFDQRVMSGRPGSRAGGEPVSRIGVIVTIDENHSAGEIEGRYGAEITSMAGDMAVLSLPVDSLGSLAACNAVRRVSAGTLKKTDMYFARSSGRVNYIQQGSDGLPQSYTGKGVVVGMMDQGMDPNHINFSVSGDYDKSRVRAVYAYNGTDGKPTASALTEEEIRDFTTDMADASHGTHVMGIAAGSFNGAASFGLEGNPFTNTKMPYYGVSVDADIVMCGGILSDANIVNGVEKVIGYAEAAGKPAVVNLSLGSILGPHDGTGELCRYLERLGSRAIICISAGNEGGDNCSVRMTNGLSRSNNAIGFSLGEDVSRPYIIQYWGNSSAEFKFDFVLYSSTTKEVIYSLPVPNTAGRMKAVGGTSMGTSYEKNDYFTSAFTADSYASFWSQVEDNDRYCVQMQCVFNRGESSDRSIMPAIRVTRVSGQQVFGYLYTPGENSVGTFVRGESGITGLSWQTPTSNGSISDMATARNVISVGAYTSSQYFSIQDGTQYSYNGSTPDGTVCSFSSYGMNPMDSKETFPLVAAPGSAIVSSMSNYYKKDYLVSGSAGGNGRTNYWGPMQGTSMSCPFVSGTVGLWLEADPTLTVDDVKSIITSTAVAPASSLSSDDKIKWGAGKLDALAGIKEVLRRKAEAGIDGVVADAGGYVITPAPGLRGYDVVVDGADRLTARLYNMQGIAVAEAHGQDGQLTLDASAVGTGVYVLVIEAPNTAPVSRRVAIR